MKIIFVTYCRAMFGANLCMLSLIKDLIERYDIEPMVIVPAVNDGTLEETLIEEKIPYLISETKPWVVDENAKLKWLRGIKACVLSKRYARNIAKVLNNHHYDMVYSNNSTIQLGADIAKMMNIPHVWHIREFGKVDYHIEYSYFKMFVRRKFEKATKVITVSDNLKRYFDSTISKKCNTEIIYDGIEDRNKEYLRHNSVDGICNFVCVGVLQEGKNQMELLQAAQILKSITNNPFHIHFVGEGQEYAEKLRTFCEQQDLKDIVTFYGYQRDVNSILNKMNVGIICSKSEAFGRVTVEYMLSSLPVIGAAGAGTSEIVEDGKTGLLYSSGKPEELAQCMLKLMKDHEMCNKMGKDGFLRAKSLFLTQRNTDEVYRIFKVACDTRKEK